MYPKNNNTIFIWIMITILLFSTISLLSKLTQSETVEVGQVCLLAH